MNQMVARTDLSYVEIEEEIFVTPTEMVVNHEERNGVRKLLNICIWVEAVWKNMA